MKNIFFRDGILIYYGNPAGYLSEGKVVLDSIFDKEEIIAFLSEKEKLAVEIRSGVYDRLSEGGGMEMTVEASKGSETSNRQRVLEERTGIHPTVQWSRTGNLQLNEEVTVTVTMQKDLGLFGNFGSFPITIRARASGKSEVYWK